MKIKEFQKTIWDFYKRNKRDFPWRETFDPYNILISEVMLQQTQTFRVLPKYEAWIKKFPNFESLAVTPLISVLQSWSGLGYNRRALYLQKTAQKVVSEFNGKLPMNPKVLQTFPGTGPNTAGSVYVFSTNKPHVFIETNIRRVFIHFFYSGHPELVSGSPRFRNKFGMTALINDKDLLPLIERALDKKNPREWYYALMDYGSFLAKTLENPNRKSKHYAKQSKFKGSLRQVRGAILRHLLENKKMKIVELEEKIKTKKEFFKKALVQLEKEEFIIKEKSLIQIR